MSSSYHDSLGSVLEPLASKYVVERTIGQGAYGTVFAARERGDHGRRVAIKLVRQPLADLGDAKRVLREVSILSRLRGSENVVSLLDVVHAQVGPNVLAFVAGSQAMDEDSESYRSDFVGGLADVGNSSRRSDFLTNSAFNKGTNSSSSIHSAAAPVPAAALPAWASQASVNVFLVTELMNCDLSHVLRAGQRLSIDHVRLFLYQILRGLKYLHSAKVVHRDLKPSNVLINTDTCDLKICDLGASRVQVQSTLDMSGLQDCGILFYAAPEGLYNEGFYSAAVDVWAAGCLGAEMLLKQPLFTGHDSFDQLTAIAQVCGPPPADIVASVSDPFFHQHLATVCGSPDASLRVQLAGAPADAVHLIESLLRWDPKDRPTAAQALTHPFFAALHDPSDEPVSPCPIPALDMPNDDDTDTMDRPTLMNRLFMELRRWGPTIPMK